MFNVAPNQAFVFGLDLTDLKILPRVLLSYLPPQKPRPSFHL